jgi:hypothetical protein
VAWRRVRVLLFIKRNSIKFLVKSDTLIFWCINKQIRRFLEPNVDGSRKGIHYYSFYFLFCFIISLHLIESWMLALRYKEDFFLLESEMELLFLLSTERSKQSLKQNYFKWIEKIRQWLVKNVSRIKKKKTEAKCSFYYRLITCIKSYSNIFIQSIFDVEINEKIFI